MRYVASALLGMSLLIAASAVRANPALLPTHDGYPGEQAISPVTGQALSHDAGQTKVFGERALDAAARSEDQHIMQTFRTPESRQLRQKVDQEDLQGAGIKTDSPAPETTQ